MFTPESTKVTLRQACNVVGLDPTDARLMRLGTNAVFRLVDPVVVRIARLDNLDEMTRTVQVARWFESDSYPAVRALAFDQPVVIDGTAATFWEALSDGETYASVPEVADLLSRLHALIPPAELILPSFEPFDRIEGRLVVSTWLTDEDRIFLEGLLGDLRERYSRLDFALRPGVMRITRKASGKTKTQAKAKLREMLRNQEDGVPIPPDGYTVTDAVRYWLTFGLRGRAQNTIDNYTVLAKVHILPSLGTQKLRDLSAEDVDTWLTEESRRCTTRTLNVFHPDLGARGIRPDQVRRVALARGEAPGR